MRLIYFNVLSCQYRNTLCNGFTSCHTYHTVCLALYLLPTECEYAEVQDRKQWRVKPNQAPGDEAYQNVEEVPYGVEGPYANVEHMQQVH